MKSFVRWGLGFLTALEAVLGFWTLLAPRQFYDTVPTVNLNPPYSEHLLRDFGGATLGLAFVLGAAALYLEYRLVCISLIALLIFSVAHLAFHATHLELFSGEETASLIALLVAAVILPVMLLLAARRIRPTLR